jgi:hypothetical protein
MSKSKATIKLEIAGILGVIVPLCSEMGISKHQYTISEDTKLPVLREALSWLNKITKTNEYRLAITFGKYFDYTERMPRMRNMCNTDLREYKDAVVYLNGLKRVLEVSTRPLIFKRGKHV